MRPLVSINQVILTWMSFIAALSPLLFTLAVELLPPPPIPADFTATFIQNHTIPQNHSTALMIDSFTNPEQNDLGFWHGPSTNLVSEPGNGYVRLYPTDPDQNYHTELGPATCFDMRPYQNMYLHIVFSGSTKFTVSLNQHNEKCDSRRSPFLQTWDSIEAERYARGNDIYVPLSHFEIDQSRTVSISFHGFFSEEMLSLYKVEIVPELPKGFYVPPKLETGKLFFHFGAGLRDKEANLSDVYKEMLQRGHQIALHSDTHQQIEGLDTVMAIDEEIVHNIETFQRVLGIESRYFRPPYGTVGARTRQRLAAYIKDPYVINWSVDVEDWLWAESKTPERQRDAFFRDVGRGGNLVVMHYLNSTTVQYFREFIRFVKSLNVDIMRVDQCLEDPKSPPFDPNRYRERGVGRYRIQSNRKPGNSHYQEPAGHV